MSNIVEYTVDTNEYFQGFVESTSMKPCDAIKELEQNIKKSSSNDNYFHVNFYDNVQNLLDVIVLKKPYNMINIPNISYLSLDDNSNKPMTKINAQNMMKSLMKTEKNGGIGCFNFGEILACYVLTEGKGYVLYCNKNTNETWKVTFKKGKCPFLDFNISRDSKESNLIAKELSNSECPDNGTLKIIVPNEEYDLSFSPCIFKDICSYIDLKINELPYPKWITNPDIKDLFNDNIYKFKTTTKYYILVNDDLRVDITKLQDKHWLYVDNIASNARANSESKKFKECNSGKRRSKLSNYELTIQTAILPYTFNGKTDKNQLYFNVSGFNLNIKDKNEIIKLIYPNAGGNSALQHTFTLIKLKCIKTDNDNDEKNTWIKKNIFNFYPDKLKTGDPIINWKYIQNYIKNDFQYYYAKISHNEVTGIPDCFAVRNRYCPSLENKMFVHQPAKTDENGIKIPSKFVPYEPESESESEPESESESEPESESESESDGPVDKPVDYDSELIDDDKLKASVISKINKEKNKTNLITGEFIYQQNNNDEQYSDDC